jgi:hypothetical protein
MSPKLLTEIVSPVLLEAALPPAAVGAAVEPVAAGLDVWLPDVLTETPPPELPHAASTASTAVKTIFFM